MISPHQQQALDALKSLDHHPTVRSLADHMETRYHRSARWSDDEVRGLLETLVDKGLVARYQGEHGEVRYQITIRATEGDNDPA